MANGFHLLLLIKVGPKTALALFHLKYHEAPSTDVLRHAALDPYVLQRATVMQEPVGWHIRIVLEKLVCGNLEFELPVQLVERKPAIVRHVGIGVPQTCQHMALVGQLQVEALSSKSRTERALAFTD
ncbi:hypothetical protein ACHAPT_012157 [Fusarium lateritium]